MYDDTISWVAAEYEHQEHGADWYWALGIITVSLAIAFIIAGNMLLSVIIILGMGILLYYEKHPAPVVEYKISKAGIRAGKILYPWESLHSFWILQKEEDAKDYHAPKLLLVSKKHLMPHIVIPLTEFVLEDVHEIIGKMVPEEPRVEPLPDRLMRKLGF